MSNDDAQKLFIGDNIAVAETSSGKVRGYILRDVFHFLGIPYGKNTSGSGRFIPPVKPDPWKDVFPAIWWGNSAPQIMENRYADRFRAFTDHSNYDDISENCLSINIWTTGYKEGPGRPVLLWLHGGGMINGNGHDQDGYNGENLSRLGNIVFCSINHRLGPFGFSDMSGVGGEKYAASGNAGILDIIAALEWIRDNIGHFGGDPKNVTIMGQSGGGGKVCALTAMPSAKGLFHKAVVLSSSPLKAGEPEFTRKVGWCILKEAGLVASQIHKLHEIKWPDYLRIAHAALRKANAEDDSDRNGGKRGFNPVVDGYWLPQHPYYPEGAPTAANIPMLICSTFNEQSPTRFDSFLETMSADEVIEKLYSGDGGGPVLGEKAANAYDAYASSFPKMNPASVWSMIISNRKRYIDLANVKARQPAPVFLAWFGWQPPLFDNRMRAFHCSDICFWFFNTDKMLTHTGGGSRPRELSSKMAGALLQFMRNGNPDGGGLPEWPAYTSDLGETMVLDDQPALRNDPDREARESLT
jgi:para-nitrobenzyl esterase